MYFEIDRGDSIDGVDRVDDGACVIGWRQWEVRSGGGLRDGFEFKVQR